MMMMVMLYNLTMSMTLFHLLSILFVLCQMRRSSLATGVWKELALPYFATMFESLHSLQCKGCTLQTVGGNFWIYNPSCRFCWATGFLNARHGRFRIFLIICPWLCLSFVHALTEPDKILPSLMRPGWVHACKTSAGENCPICGEYVARLGIRIFLCCTTTFSS